MNRLRTLCAGVLAAAVSVSGLAATGTAHADAARARSEVSLEVSDHEPEVKDRVTFTGSVSPARTGQAVVLQVRYEGQHQWKVVARTRLDHAGKYVFNEQVRTLRERTYRVVRPAVGRSGRAVSAKEKVTVFRWRYLTSLDPVAASAMHETNTASMNAEAYSHSVVASTPVASVDYDLDRDCTALRGFPGLSDTSPPSSTSTVAISTDGVSRFSRSFALTQTALVTLDVTDAVRLTVSATSDDGGLGVLGTTRVLCRS